MPKENKNPYQEGHLFVAAIRVLEHQNSAPPTIDQIAEMLQLSAEQAGFISRRMQEAGIIKIVESAYGDRWGVDDHLKIEEIPQQAEKSQLDEALKQFKSEKDKLAQKVESIKAQQAKKKQDLFSEIEQKLKKDMKDRKP